MSPVWVLQYYAPSDKDRRRLAFFEFVCRYCSQLKWHNQDLVRRRPHGPAVCGQTDAQKAHRESRGHKGRHFFWCTPALRQHSPMGLSDIAALTSCTRLNTTLVAACSATTACTALGPKIDATMNTGDWKYETLGVKRTATGVMKLENASGGVQKTALRVSRKVRGREWIVKRVGDDRIEQRQSRRSALN